MKKITEIKIENVLKKIGFVVDEDEKIIYMRNVDNFYSTSAFISYLRIMACYTDSHSNLEISREIRELIKTALENDFNNRKIIDYILVVFDELNGKEMYINDEIFTIESRF